MEDLEQKSLMTAINIGGGVIRIDGLAQATIAEVKFDSRFALNPFDDAFVVTLRDRNTGQLIESAETYGGWGHGITRVEYSGGDGDDVFVNNTGLVAYANGQNGNDYLVGGDANDVITGGSGTDTIFGRRGDDQLDGGVGGVAVYADNTGNDALYGGDGNDTLNASDYGNNALYGEAGNDVLNGWGGNDVLDGGDGDDRLSGYTGYDRLFGGNGNDRLDGGLDGVSDYLEGGTGDDEFIEHLRWTGLAWVSEHEYNVDFNWTGRDRLTRVYG